MGIHSDLIPEEIKQEYNTDEYAEKEGLRLHGSNRCNIWIVAVRIPCQPRSYETSSYLWVLSSLNNTRTIKTGNKENYIPTGKSVMQSAAEAECGALFMNAKEAVLNENNIMSK